jgi:hypothetical protein
MFRKLSFTSATFALMTIILASAVANAQTQSRPTSTPAPTPTPKPQNQSIVKAQEKIRFKEGDLKTTTEGSTNSASAKGWDGKVQGRVLVTPVTVTFDNPQDYDNFAAGRLRLNLIAKNTLSGQTVRLDSRQLSEGFRPAPDKSRLTINVIADNMSAPLSEAACGVISPSAENTAEGVNITLSYAGCGGQPTQFSAAYRGHLNQQGKNLSGNLNIVVGASRIMTREEATAMSRASGGIAGPLSKGAGSPKNAGF